MKITMINCPKAVVNVPVNKVQKLDAYNTEQVKKYCFVCPLGSDAKIIEAYNELARRSIASKKPV